MRVPGKTSLLEEMFRFRTVWRNLVLDKETLDILLHLKIYKGNALFTNLMWSVCVFCLSRWSLLWAGTWMGFEGL